LTGRTPPGMADEPRPQDDALVESGTTAFRNTILALFCAGFATFALLYYVRPLLPVFSESFGLGAAQASLALSVPTGLMAPAMLVAGAISETLPVVIAGIAVLTFGFFGAHSVASAWVGRRARTAKAQAASLYLFLYYVGSSVIGSLGGVFWERNGWSGVVALVTLLLAAAFLISLRLMRLEPLSS
jgi:nicotinic acid phosphoribosyltransferase